MSNMQEMFDMELPEWLEESEEARGSKKAIVAVIMFFLLFLVGNVIPTILQMISLVSFIIKEIDLSSLNPASSITIEGTVEGDSYQQSYEGENYSAFGMDAETMAQLEAILEWLEADVESTGEIDQWEDNAEEEILDQINQGTLTVPEGMKEELSLFEGESMTEILESYADTVYEKTMKLMGKLPPSFYLVALYSTVFATLTFIFWARFAEKRSFRSLGFTSGNFLSKYLKGLGIGFLLFGMVVLLNLGSGSIEFGGINPKFSFGSCLLFFGGFILQGMNEEVMFRGYLMSRLSVKEKFWTAVIVNSVLFGFFHMLNAGVTLLAIVNIILFGIFASLYAMADDGIAGACAIHTIWNFLQGNIFGFEVSGNNMGEPLLLLGEEKANIINGGTFGAEGGLAVTVVLVIAVIIVFEKNSRNSKWIMV
ncbi:MAG: CPBP family intramembrane metalloprotease [Lachnospiraceae bacterium]|nr:CPBP family intramembrane metalloprotease [Lachnospiraceae bacterium]